MREVVPSALAGERIDRVVAIMTGLTRAEVASLIDGGVVLVDGKASTKPSKRVVEGNVVEVDVPERTPPEPLAGDPTIPVDVVHADDAVIVVDKQPHLVVHPGAGNRQGTLVNALLARFPDLAELAHADGIDPDRPGIVHRLDAGTSGLLVVARTADAHASLVAQLSARTVGRRYRVVTLGHVEPASGVVDAPIGRSPSDPTRMAVVNGGREARTRYDVVATFTDPIPTCELVCSLETGRTHQIRVHFAAIGHPVAGDERYGGDRPALALGRPFLHAEELAFDHPVTGERVRFTSALPADLVEVRATLS